MSGRRLATLTAILATTLAPACTLRSGLRPPEPVLLEADWTVHGLPGTPLLFSMPPEFEAGDDFGCYEGHVQPAPLPYGPGWRAFCIGIHPPTEPIPLFLEGVTPGCQADCLDFEEVRTTRMTLGRKDVIVQTAYVSGGFEGRVRSPEMLVQIPFPHGLTILRAQYGDAADAAVILGIAQTISAPTRGNAGRESVWRS